jgi:tetratricopeptide (TPR) repeat protein
MEQNKVEFFNKLSFNILLGTIFLTLFFFFPYLSVTLEASKSFILSIGVTLSVFFWLISILGNGKVKIPKDKLILFGALIPVVFLLASIFSYSFDISLFGNGFEIGTFSSMLTLFLLFSLSSVFFQNNKRLWLYVLSLFVAGLVIIIFQLINVFIGFDKVLPGFLQGMSYGNVVGSWNNFALIIGLISLLSLFTIELLKTNIILKIIQYFLLVFGILFLIIINFQFIWILLGILSILIFVYSISLQHSEADVNENNKVKKFPFISLAVILISITFLVGGNLINGLVSKYVNLNVSEARPSIIATSQIVYKAIRHNPVLGTGPNTFMIDWALWQPKEIAQTFFWNVDFDSGFSLLMTFIATTGILGFVSLILFLFVYAIRGYQSLRIALEDRLSNYFIATILMASVYSWLSIIFYSPNILMLMMAFSSSGVLIGILISKQKISNKEYSFFSHTRNDFFSILILLVLVIFTLSLSYIYVEKFSSIVYFSKGLNSNNSVESLSQSEKLFLKAITLDKNDVYYRNLSQLYISQINLLINRKDISEENLKSALQQLINLSQESAKLAVRQNSKLYLNYINLGNVYSSLVPLGVTYSYESSLNAYEQAFLLSPNNPLIYYNKAILEFFNKNNKGARENIGEALKLKNNYIDAIFLLVQIETEEGNLNEAIKQAEYASTLAPNDPTVFFRLGLLKYNKGDFKGSVDNLERAVILNNRYLNARFFLGQSYKRIGRISDALIQFNILNEISPNNKEIIDAINSINLSSDRVSSDVKTDEIVKPPLEEN